MHNQAEFSFFLLLILLLLFIHNRQTIIHSLRNAITIMNRASFMENLRHLNQNLLLFIMLALSGTRYFKSVQNLLCFQL